MRNKREEDAAFNSAIEYGLRCIGKRSLVLNEKLSVIYRQRCLSVAAYWLCWYELLPFVMDYKRGMQSSGEDSTVVVILPLVSLMIDQVTAEA